MAARQKSVRKITAERKEQINHLAEIIYDFLPLTARSKKAVTFYSIFTESKIEHYLDGHGSKSLALQNGLEKLMRHHLHLPKTIMRKIVPAAIRYRKYKRKPIKLNEIAELSECLINVGIDMYNELAAIDIDDELPCVRIPPDKLKEYLRNHCIVRELSAEPMELFENGHFNEAVRKAFELFEDSVKDRTGIDKYGQELMGNAFSDGKNLNITIIEPENQQSFINGFKFLAMGSMSAIRNVFSHGDEKPRSPEECLELFLFANWMFRGLTQNK